MLEELTIRNYALIDSLTVEFSEGLNILSGETGAGKSIIIGALSFLLGGRGDPSLIRTGCDETVIAASVRMPENKDLENWLGNRGIDPDNGYLLIRRTLKKNGRSSGYVQSVPVTRADLSELTSFLFDMHGQHAHQSLLNTDAHRSLLDSYSGTTGDVERLKSMFAELSVLRRSFEDLNKSEREILIEQDILSHAIKEIDEAELVKGEYEELLQERKILVEYENLMELLETFSSSLSGIDGGALSGLQKARAALGKIAAISEDAGALAERLDNAYFEIEDIFETVSSMRDNAGFSPERLEACEDRLQLIRRLQKKYGDTVEEILAYRDEARKKLAGYAGREEEIESLREKISGLEKEVLKLAADISSRRKKMAESLESDILKGLRHLGMKKASFKIEVRGRESSEGKQSCGPTGMDTVEFMISANEGEPLKPLKKVASGGELSRIMLSIKTVLADSDKISTLIFDEIDTGIGGEIGLAVGDHLSSLSRSKQILCITHLASIAVRADNHLKVDKNVEKGRTYTDVKVITGEERVREIARMLSGDADGSASLEHAREMLGRYSGPE